MTITGDVRRAAPTLAGPGGLTASTAPAVPSEPAVPAGPVAVAAGAGRSYGTGGVGAAVRPAAGADKSYAEAGRAFGASRSWQRLGGQAAVVALAVAAYFGVRGATEAAFGEALANAHRVIDVERGLGIYHEGAIQSALAGVPGLTTAMNWIYIWGHWPVIVVTLLWLAHRHPATFRRTRNAMMLSGAVGLVVFLFFPVAPPRLAELGMVDTVTAQSHAYRVLQPAIFTNQYAAMPSLHVGWDLLIGLAIVTTARHTLLRAVGVAMPVAMSVSVVLTANHYILDAVVGVALVIACWIACGRPWRRSEPMNLAFSRASNRA